MHTPPPSVQCWDAVNKRAVRIPLEYILVFKWCLFLSVRRTELPRNDKVGSVDIFVLLKLENKMDRVFRVINCNLKYYYKCKFVLKLIMF